MSTAAVLVVLAVVVAVVVVVLAVLRAWSIDRDGQRGLIRDLGTLWGPEGSRAAGQAWTSIAGDGPPALRLRARGVEAETGTPSSSTPSAAAPAGEEIEPPPTAQSV